MLRGRTGPKPCRSDTLSVRPVCPLAEGTHRDEKSCGARRRRTLIGAREPECQTGRSGSTRHPSFVATSTSASDSFSDRQTPYARHSFTIARRRVGGGLDARAPRLLTKANTLVTARGDSHVRLVTWSISSDKLMVVEQEDFHGHHRGSSDRSGVTFRSKGHGEVDGGTPSMRRPTDRQESTGTRLHRHHRVPQERISWYLDSRIIAPEAPSGRGPPSKADGRAC